MPLYHCFGSVIGSMVSAVYGATLILPSAQFDAARHTGGGAKASGRRRFTASPRCTWRRLEHPEFDRFDLSSLRKGVMSGAPCPIELMKHVGERMHWSAW